MSEALDEVDLAILDILREDGRINIRALADHVGLPETTARDRLHRLERDRFIRGYRVLVDNRAVGMPVQAWVLLDAPPNKLMETATALWSDPSVLDGFALAERPNGVAIKMAAKDTERLGRVLEKWRNDLGIEIRDLLLLDDLNAQPVDLEDMQWEQAVLRTMKNQF